jgi:hypothetical protein
MSTPIHPSVADFKIHRVVCEARYTDAYLLYDKTGQLLEDVRRSFTNVKVVVAAPNQTLFTADQGAFGIEVGQSRFTSDEPDPKLEKFGKQCKDFFDVIAEDLKINVFTRIGLRTFFHRECKTKEETLEVLAAVDLINLKAGVRFGVEGAPSEISVRWEDKQLGTRFALGVQAAQIDLLLPPELKGDRPDIHKAIVGLNLDVDYYTVAPVDRGQWNPAEWIPQKIRLIKKEADKILQGDQ